MGLKSPIENKVTTRGTFGYSRSNENGAARVITLSDQEILSGVFFRLN